MLTYNFFIFLNGISDAARLFIISCGLTLIFGLMRIVNLAHGVLYLAGGYIGLSVMKYTGSYLLALAGGALAIAIVGFLIERGLLSWVRGQDLPETLVTLALIVIFQDTLLAIWGGYPEAIPKPALLDFSINILDLPYPAMRLFAILVAIFIGFGLWLFIEKTNIGAAIRAGVDDRETASALGINIRVIFTFVFCIGAFLAGFAGVIGATLTSLAPGLDSQALLFALVVIIIGGLGSLLGSAIGAVIVGLILNYGRSYVPEFAFLLTFLPMLLIIAFRPQGLLGKK
ncbi:MAG: branched-chain amino acid ABC transporter permease [Deltaproteobacteria bacterium]|uniref:Branched-chain amino acid ABC transporter permease n=1 Tax=Candidatus Desulfacyla euxinica TaxID=2841693 RepID=A0A8J6TAI4_9DELT|nr:branched-chain amino acid ABC transporter permease [Candidatus Desulfacyla euxinica]